MPSKLELPILKLSAKARDLFIRFYDDIERRLVGDLSGHGDVGSKAAEQALRIAGVMTFYENPTPQLGDGGILFFKNTFGEFVPVFLSQSTPIHDGSNLIYLPIRRNSLDPIWEGDIDDWPTAH